MFAENRAGRIRLAFGPPGSAHTPRISKVVEKNDALPAAGRQCGEAIAMAGYAALATTAATHDGTLNIERRWSSARNQCVLILRELGAKPTQCSSFFTLGALRADLALKLTRYCGTPAPMSPRRRRVTAMVSDLWVGLSFSARVNPRQLRAVGSTFRKCVAETAGSFGGF